MDPLNKIDTSLLDNIIFGRVDPKIYAFTTKTVPNYLKVGDTYRPLESRLNEWRKYFPNLEKKFEDVAKIDNQVFFRDHAIHSFLENEKEKHRLKKNEIKNISHYSNEFFKSTSEKDVESAIKDIKKSHKDNQNKYQYYKFEESRVPVEHIYERVENYDPRPNQKETINKFKKAVASGGNNLLMYAVMRFGKSFTSMCCAVEMKASTVLVVSAKADVKEEWKTTVESHKKFTDYIFFDNKKLLDSETVVKEKLNVGKKVVIFLTLQDLQGKEIKRKHKEIFQNKIDLLIIDETHFGARAEEYGKVLRGVNKKDIKQELRLNDESLDELDKEMKILDTRIRLHLSGTPYRILMESEFKDKDIIAFYQFSDIAEDQKKWDEKNLYKDDVKEWDNPYYGFPQMVRFAFHPNESSRKKMEELRSNGSSYALSELLRPQSITKDIKGNLHKKFKHEAEVFDLLKVIDGSKHDENILNFLDYEKIKEGRMCRHIVFVLPFCASCDALEVLLKSKKFKNLREYEVINISGVDADKKYKTTKSVQSKIERCESKNLKTITLTVNRMLTGSTVPVWDTMLFLKDTASPQEYDQAVFRLQNQYVRTYKEPNGDTVKFNMKPQTLLVDFSPNRMFEMQEQKALIYIANTDRRGGAELKTQIKRELNISPIIFLNNNKIKEITPADILNAVREYSKERGVDDEARAIPIDTGLLNIPEIRAEIERQNEIGSKQGLEVSAVEGEGDDIEVEDINKEALKNDKTDQELSGVDKESEEDFRKKFATYYMRILFFAFLTNSKVESLQDIIKEIISNKKNERIINNLGINKNVLALFQKHVSPFTLVELDRKIHNINSLANDKEIKPEDSARIAMRKFTRLSESEVVTPEFIAGKMIDALPEKEIKKSTKILDIASKQGEFVHAIYSRFGKKIANNVYSIPTSKAAYEFTRKMYESLGLNVDNIEKKYTSYHLIEDNEIINGKNVRINSTNMKFDVIVGNPPYQQNVSSAKDNSALSRQIFPYFIMLCIKLNPEYLSIITPSRWFAGDAQDKSFLKLRKFIKENNNIKEIHNYSDASEVFNGVEIKGGVNYFLMEKDFVGQTTFYNYKNNEIYSDKRDLFAGNVDIILTNNIFLNSIKKIRNQEFKSLMEITTGRNAFGVIGKPSYLKKVSSSVKKKGYCKLICKNNEIRYIKSSLIKKNKDMFESYKVFISKSSGAPHSDKKIISKAFVGRPFEACTDTYFPIGTLKSEQEANNLKKYFYTKFLRYLVSIMKSSHNVTQIVYEFVPLQDFTKKSDIDWSKSISEIDKQLYGKYSLTKKEKDFIEKNVKPME